MSFTFEPARTRVVFGRGTAATVRAEAERLGAARVLLIARHGGDRVAAELGPLLTARFTGAAMHTPVEVTERALALLREHSADCVVSVGGGSSTGLSKALSVRAGVPQIIIPTTYAGSEVTPVLGETASGLKKTRRDAAIQPDTVIYDVDLTLDLPIDVTVTSALNALAHAVGARGNENPLIDAIATRAIDGILSALGGNPSTVEARTALLSSAWLAGTCLASVPMGLHHKLAHVLGGSFGLPHAATHTALLSHTAPVDLVEQVHDTAARFGAATSLRQLGMAESDLSRAAEIAEHPDALRVLTSAWRDASSG
ncbi:iron-containing alcohol dehydrogenase [Lentzea sp. BCCO 10_0856]|uniref:Iron-containing alcohol dehydrogenase n=1 Tax=Lentzea miocenica TaxID=3095431 RepID=A0ABU4TCJ2_9PSEU|nr:iron-containing alcohol dehydrogenase [Lentzea sp. BCCO 10_0856]MDX8035900.1 iron-containing alcohol dehydrogenase [Lentzea sp. BCCO 10_0856]